MNTMGNLSLVFAAGCWGAWWNSLAVWFLGLIGITAALGVHLPPPLTPAFLYPRLIWGGIWGLLFLVPLGRLPFPDRGLIYSLGPPWCNFSWSFPSRPTKELAAWSWATSLPSLWYSTMPFGDMPPACG
jgi:hypothetical protein